MTAKPSIYFDNNASAPLLDCVREAIAAALQTDLANPGSSHGAGAQARALLEHARQQVAQLASADFGQIVFCGSGTEANNQVLKSIAAALPTGHQVLTSQIEHSSVLSACHWLESQSVPIAYSAVQRDGVVDLNFVEDALEGTVGLVSIQWVNNETGVIQPIQEIASLAKRRGAIVHCDATQALGKLPFDDRLDQVDFLTVSGHKIHAPQGCGAIIAKDLRPLAPFIHGGDQESGRRGGTENLLGIIGFGAAAQHRQENFAAIGAKLRLLRDHFESQVIGRLGDVVINGGTAARVANTANIGLAPMDGAALVAQLDRNGVYCSQSSACTNSRPESSYVLRAMGLSESEAYGSIRFSFSELNTVAEIDSAVQVMADLCSKLRLALGI